MDIIIQSLGFKAGETLESFITEKVNTLKYDNVVRANVTLFKGPASAPGNDYCEILLEIPGNDAFVKKSGAHFETAVSECVDVLSENLHRLKSKQISHRQTAANAIQDAFINDETDLDTELEDVVKNK
ncbi:MAG: HPF/RaiA family ribosome-associated protein [Bacteroidota bacterium]